MQEIREGFAYWWEWPSKEENVDDAREGDVLTLHHRGDRGVWERGRGGPGWARSGAALPPHPARRQHPWAPRPGAGGGGHASAGSFPIGPELSVRQETGPCPERNDGKGGVRALTREKAEGGSHGGERQRILQPPDKSRRATMNPQ